MLQDLLGLAWSPLGNSRNTASAAFATALFVGAWGWFLYQGVVDPHGGINSLWPLFGIANQLLAVLALALGTTVLVKMGRVRYIWVTLLPLAWLLIVTISASLMKIFSPAPLGFFATARELQRKIVLGGSADQLETWQTQIVHCWINGALASLFLLLVVIVVGQNALIWVQACRGRHVPKLEEDTFVVAKGQP